MRTPLQGSFAAAVLAGGVLTVSLAAVTPAQAAEDSIDGLLARMAAQDQRIAEQERRLSEQAAVIEAQGAEIRALRVRGEEALAELRGGRRLAAAAPPSPGPTQVAVRQVEPPLPGMPGRPVGEAPPAERQAENTAAIPEGMGVLTPKGGLQIEPSFEFSRSSANRLVFRGVEIIPGVQLGVIDASDADRDTLVGTLAARYGLTDRIEVEARIPYLYRHDRVTIVAQRDESVTRTTTLEAQDFGDAEFAARYQINRGLAGQPIFVANLRVKPPTGKSPYDVGYDEFGVATGLATGSGFWGTELGLTMLYPTDPAVIFAGLGYLYNAPRDIDKIVGSVPVGEVDPGDSISASVGFGLALNPRFSISLGYSHHYIFATKSELGTTTQKSNTLQVGALQFGWSFRLTERLSLSNNFEFGVTSDAPDMRVVVRLPYRF